MDLSCVPSRTQKYVTTSITTNSMESLCFFIVVVLIQSYYTAIHVGKVRG